MWEFNLPRLDVQEGSPEAIKIKSYLFQLTEQLKYLFSAIDTENLAPELSDAIQAAASATGQVNELRESTQRDLVRIKNQAADYIVERGTFGDWTYEKWASGKAECWCKHNVTGKFTTARNAPFYAPEDGADPVSISYPTNLFSAIPNCNITAALSTAWNYPFGWIYSHSKSAVAFIPVLAGQAGTSVTVTYYIRSVGKWI